MGHVVIAAVRHLFAVVVGWWHRCRLCGEHVPGGNVEMHVRHEHTEWTR